MRAGVTINGLPILALEPGLDQYYLNNVIGGPNAFIIVAETFEAFAEAVLKKLITEIAALPVQRRVCSRCRAQRVPKQAFCGDQPRPGQTGCEPDACD